MVRAMAILFLASCAPAVAAPRTLALNPADMLAQFHAHSLIMTITGTYLQLSGTLEIDPQARTCRIDVRFVVRSLSTANALARGPMMSKSFLDPADFPQTRYLGTCRGQQLTGDLILRGQTHPFDMALTYTGPPGQPGSLHAEGVLNREDWGVAGLALAVGKHIRITNDISLNGAPPVPWRGP